MVNKKHILIILIAIGAISSVMGIAIAITVNTPDPNVYTDTIYVSTTGNDANNGFTLENSKKSIKKAVENAPDGATVFVAPGTYIEDTIDIKQNLKLIGSGQENTLILSKGRAIRNYGDRVYVKGLTVRQKDFSHLYCGIMNWEGFLTVEDCKVMNYNSIDSLSFHNSRGTLVIKDCSIIDHKSLPEYERSLH